MLRNSHGWTTQLHHDNLAVLVAEDIALAPMPSYSTLRRYRRENALERRQAPKRASAGAQAAQARHERLETRSYEVSHVNGLWHLDFHHGTRQVLEPDGRWIKPILLCVLDDHSRLVCHLQWYRHEGVESLVHGFSQTIAKRGLPRALMSDYVPRNIIDVLLPSPLCGRPSRNGRRYRRGSRSRQHSDHSDFSHFSSAGSSLHREWPREVPGSALSSAQTSSASAFILSVISA